MQVLFSTVLDGYAASAPLASIWLFTSETLGYFSFQAPDATLNIAYSLVLNVSNIFSSAALSSDLLLSAFVMKVFAEIIIGLLTFIKRLLRQLFSAPPLLYIPIGTFSKQLL